MSAGVFQQRSFRGMKTYHGTYTEHGGAVVVADDATEGNALQGRVLPDNQPLLPTVHLLDEAQLAATKRLPHGPVATRQLAQQLIIADASMEGLDGERRLVRLANRRIGFAQLQ